MEMPPASWSIRLTRVWSFSPTIFWTSTSAGFTGARVPSFRAIGRKNECSLLGDDDDVDCDASRRSWSCRSASCRSISWVRVDARPDVVAATAAASPALGSARRTVVAATPEPLDAPAPIL